MYGFHSVPRVCTLVLFMLSLFLSCPISLSPCHCQFSRYPVPGGLQNSSTAVTPPPVGGSSVQEGVKTEVDLDDSVEITCVESVSDEPVLVMSSPHKPHPSPAPTSTDHTPVLFTDSSATPKPVPLCKETEDDDATPPLLPHPHLQEGNKGGVVKAATPRRRTKANMRMTLNRSCKTSLIGGCGQNRSSIAEVSELFGVWLALIGVSQQVGRAITCSSCGISLTSSEGIIGITTHIFRGQVPRLTLEVWSNNNVS